MRKKLFGRILSIVLSATMAFSPSITAFAEGSDDTVPVEDIETTEEETDTEEETVKTPENLGEELGRGTKETGAQQDPVVVEPVEEETPVDESVIMEDEGEDPEEFTVSFYLDYPIGSQAKYNEDEIKANSDNDYIIKALLPGDPTKDGYSFGGWVLPSGEGLSDDPYDFNERIYNNIDFFAKWVAEQYTVTLDANTDEPVTGLDDTEITVNYDATYPQLPVPERSGYEFAGWFDAATDGNPVTEKTKVNKAENHTLYAHWTAKKYTITFDANGGAFAGEEAPTYEITTGEAFGENFGNVETPTSDALKFSSWNTKKDGSGLEATESTVLSSSNFDAFVDAEGKITLYAQWANKASYVVTFRSNGGTAVRAQDVYEGGKVEEPTAPTREGYTFAGWYKDSALSESFNFETETISQKTTLYAKWVGLSYKIKFNKNLDSATGEMPELPMVYGDAKELTKNAYEDDESLFLNWNTKADGTGTTYDDEEEVNILPALDKDGNPVDITLYAQWETVVTITFDAGEGGVVGENQTKAVEIAKGGRVKEEIPDAVKSGYVFDGWFDENGKEFNSYTTYTENTTFTAKYVKAITLTFDLDGGKIGDLAENVSITVGEGYTISSDDYDELLTVEKEGYILKGFNTVGETSVEFNAKEPVTKNSPTSYKATWIKEHTIKFYIDEDKTEFATVNVADNSTCSNPGTPKKDGYAFGGWFNAEDTEAEFDPTAPVTEDAEYIAKWLERVEITFDANGGQFAASSIEKTVYGYKGTEYGPVIDKVPTRTGYKFGGWATSTTAKEADYDEKAIITVAKTFYAVWTPITYTIKLNYNGGEGTIESGNSITATYGEDTDIVGMLSWSGNTDSVYYTQGGWTLNKHAAGSYYDSDIFIPIYPDIDGETRKATIEAGSELTTKDGATINLYAYWYPQANEVTFHYGHQVTIDSVTTDEQSLFVAYGSYGYYGLTYRTGGYYQGYYFDGWYKGTAEGSDYKEKIDLSKKYDLTFTHVWAKWSPVTFNVTYHSTLTKDSTAKVSYDYDDVKESEDVVSITDIFAKDKNIAAITEKAEDPGLASWSSSISGLSLVADVEEGQLVQSISDQYMINYYGESYYERYSLPKTVSLDLYAQWNVDPEKTYRVVFVAGEEDIDFGDYAAGNYGVDYIDGYGYGHIETVEADEEFYITGNEFVRKGYTLTGFTYKTSTTASKLAKAGASLKNLYTEEDGLYKVAVLTAVWSAKEVSYPITYVANGGKVVSGQKMPKSYKYSEGATLPDMVKTGYTFDGWYETSDFSGEAVTGFVAEADYGAKTVYAKFTPIMYTVKFTLSEEDYNSGARIGTTAGVYPTVVSYDQTIDLSEDTYKATFAGRTFKNWKVTASTASEVKVNKTFTAKQKIKNLTKTAGAEITVVAVFADNSYAISYNLNGGKKANKGKYPTKYKPVDTEGGSYVEITNPVRAGYSFKGWDSDGDGGADMLPAVGAGYFGLQGSYEKLTLKAIWTPIDYTIRLYKNNGTGLVEIDDKDVVTNNIVTAAELAAAANDLEASAKTIIGFAATKGATKAKYVLTKNYKLTDLIGLADEDGIIELYAVNGKDEIGYITYDIPEDASLTKEVYTYKTSSKSDTALVKAKMTGYTFLGWNYEEEDEDGLVLDKNGYAIKIKAGYTREDGTPIELTAVFDTISYSVTYVPGVNGVVDENGTKIPTKGYTISGVNYKDGKVESNDAYGALPDDWTRSGYYFDGWALDKKGTNEIDSLAELTTKKSVTIYAIWKPLTSDVEFNATAKVTNNTTNPTVDVAVAVAAAKDKLIASKKLDSNGNGMYNTAISLPKLSVQGFTFLGWVDEDASYADVKTTTKNGVTYVTQILKTNIDDINLTPYFTENTYKVMINPNGGYIRNPSTYKYVKSSIADTYNSSVVYYRDVVTSIPTDYNSYRIGYSQASAYTLDKAGKKPFNSGVDASLVSKNNGTLTLYMQWTKDDAPVIPVITSAVQNDDEDKVKVTFNTTATSSKVIIVECSSSPKFAFDVDREFVMNGNSYTFTGKTGQVYYVRARQAVYSSNSAKYSAFGSTVRASKTSDITQYVATIYEVIDNVLVEEPVGTKYVAKNAVIGIALGTPEGKEGYTTAEFWFKDKNCSGIYADTEDGDKAAADFNVYISRTTEP